VRRRPWSGPGRVSTRSGRTRTSWSSTTGPRSTIWSSRARKRSFCPLSRRSLGRSESPSAKPTERQNHDQTPPINLQEIKLTATALLQMQ
jgi:hypothetical protein